MEPTIKKLTSEHNGAMLDILHECPITTGELTICFDRVPDIFLLPGLRYDHSEYLGFFSGGKLVGFALIGYEKVWVNQKPATTFQFTDCSIRKEARKQGLIYGSFKAFFEKPYDGSECGYAIVMKGNRPAESYIGSRKQGYSFIPYSKVIGELVVRNIVITFKKRTRTPLKAGARESVKASARASLREGARESLKERARESLRDGARASLRDGARASFNVRQAEEKDISSMVELLQRDFKERLFAPYLTEEKFRRNLAERPDFDIGNYYIAEKDGKTAGVCAAWDTASFKQNRVLKYSLKFRVKKVFYSLLGFLFKFPPLPRTGESFKDVHIIEFAAENRDPAIMEALLLAVYEEYRKKKYNTIIFGTSSDDPLLEAADSFMTESVVSHIIMAGTNEELLEDGAVSTRLPYIDIAQL